MRTVIWGKSFFRGYKRTVRKHPEVTADIEKALRILEANPFALQLETHKLKGILAGSWACSVGYDLRIVFDFVEEKGRKEDAILLIDIGSHDEVY
jgi:mRNA interferase YafQ